MVSVASQEAKHTGALLIFKVVNARRKATRCALAEALSLLTHLGARELRNGPLGVQGGLFYLELPHESMNAAAELFPRLGYTASVEQVEFTDRRERGRGGDLPRWKGMPYALTTVYEVDQNLLREQAPDRREFLLPDGEGGVRSVKGYRGDGGKQRRRGLPVIDARLLVNLVFSEHGGRFLDPFAGAGGIVIEAVRSGYETFSVDVDPFVMHGLANLASHTVADARKLPFPGEHFDSIASEPPFDEEATAVLCQALPEMNRVLKPGGSVSLMTSDRQTEAALRAAEALSWQSRLCEYVDRKGSPVTVLSWRKP
jgi:16S rRNA G966 N2-methylase RsmD